MKLVQVSLYYKPINGGQQYIVDAIDRLVCSKSVSTVIIQPLNLCLIRHFLRNGNFGKVFPILNPLSPFLLFRYFIRLLPSKLAKDIHESIIWDGFNLGLFLFSRFAINKDDVILVHYHYHLESLRFCSARKIIFSHGVEWSRRNPSRLDKNKVSSLLRIFQNIDSLNVSNIIANDADYIRLCKSMMDVACSSVDINYLPNAVDASLFVHSNGNVLPNEVQKKIPGLVVCIRNVREDRGILEAIKAILILNKQSPDWQLWIAGTYKENDPYFKKCVSATLGSDKVVFLGSLSRYDVLQLYRKAFISLVPSQDKEGTSLAALESMSSGTPCVSTNIGGLVDLPTFKAADITPEAIAKAISDLSENYSKEQLRQLTITQAEFSTNSWNKRISEYLFDYQNHA
jgi:glycosyltransferase involved in cell wall biosynthesis